MLVLVISFVLHWTRVVVHMSYCLLSTKTIPKASSNTCMEKFLSLAVEVVKVKQRKSPCIQCPRRMSAAKVPGSFPRPALDRASRGHPRRLRYRQPHRQPCAGRHSKTYKCQSPIAKGAKTSAYLYPRSLYAAAADWMICAVAALPTPRSRSGGIMIPVFKIFPV